MNEDYDTTPDENEDEFLDTIPSQLGAMLEISRLEAENAALHSRLVKQETANKKLRHALATLDSPRYLKLEKLTRQVRQLVNGALEWTAEGSTMNDPGYGMTSPSAEWEAATARIANLEAENAKLREQRDALQESLNSIIHDALESIDAYILSCALDTLAWTAEEDE